jgi:acetate kinase
MFIDRILDFIGAYFVKLGGRVDALVFSGGIGERSVALRKVVGDSVRCLGFANVDAEKNSNANEGETVVDIGVRTEGKQDGKILVCRTDEQASLL